VIAASGRGIDAHVRKARAVLAPRFRTQSFGGVVNIMNSLKQERKNSFCRRKISNMRLQPTVALAARFALARAPAAEARVGLIYE
jgi:hypothetical protein